MRSSTQGVPFLVRVQQQKPESRYPFPQSGCTPREWRDSRDRTRRKVFHLIQVSPLSGNQERFAQRNHIQESAHGPSVATNPAGVLFPTGWDSHKNRFGSGSMQNEIPRHRFLCFGKQGRGVLPFHAQLKIPDTLCFKFIHKASSAFDCFFNYSHFPRQGTL